MVEPIRLVSTGEDIGVPVAVGLHKAIATLPLEQQRLIHAVHFKDVSIREYARQVGRSHYYIRTQLAKIYASLKNILEF